ncbi:MAG: hypothetical protein JW910_16995 [Anaerolineae bacterium]|nr:hypothetical protein [Anaerolineae bacterium]
MTTYTVQTAVLSLIEYYLAQPSTGAAGTRTFDRHALAAYADGLVANGAIPEPLRDVMRTLAAAQQAEAAPLQELIFGALFALRRQFRLRRDIQNPDRYTLEP